MFDEPLSNLDAKLRVATRAELKALHHKLQTTSIYVTHDQAEAMTLGDRICVMYNGKIQQIAEPMEVYDKPINRFVATLSDSNNKLSSFADREMVLGIRPEYLTVEKLTVQNDNAISATVDVVEPLGVRKDVYLTAGNGQEFIANLDLHVAIVMDQQIQMYVDTNKLHVFELGDTGSNVSL